MNQTVCTDEARIAGWLGSQLGVDVPGPVQTALGIERDGELVAAVCFDTLYDNSVCAHIVSRAPIVPPELLRATAAYAYEQLGLDRLTFFTPESNAKALMLLEDMGAEFEGRMRRATKQGDVLVHVLWRDSAFAQKCLAGVAA